MSSNLAEYLAKNYLTADKPVRRSTKKRSKQQAPGALIIQDDDDAANDTRIVRTRAEEEDDRPVLDSEAQVAPAAAKRGWKRVVEEEERIQPDEVPQIVGDVPEDDSAQRMSSGARAGLQSAKQVSADIRTRQEAERNEFLAKKKTHQEEETIYRDATGRRIDVALHRAEVRRKALEAETQAKIETELGKGLAQIRERRERDKELERVRKGGMARHADDERMNEELKAQQRWNDPAAGFIESSPAGTNKRKKTSRRPMYKGAAPPNRFGILPGYRWDGVNRSNGFERDYFKKVNERRAKMQEYHNWSVEDM